MSDPPLLEVRGAGKSFPGVVALRGVSLTLHRGEVLALIGENGAGKSTLMKILAGVQEADEGQVLVDGRVVSIGSVEHALDHGFALIHQELNLADNLDVGANIFLGREPRRGPFIDHRRIRTDSRRLLGLIGLDTSPGTRVSHLSIGHQQMVEIAKALSVEARILIMDEPTSSLSLHETEQLFRVVNDLRAQGVSVIYISHRLGEVRELADRVIVLRDGVNAGELARDEITHDRMVNLMVGRDVSRYYDHTPREPGATALEVEDLRTRHAPKESLTFNVRAGEIVGVAGLVGAGRTELLEALFGIAPAISGSVRIEGNAIDIVSPIAALKAGLALVPEDRKLQGLVLEMSVLNNLGMARLDRDARYGMLNRSAERATTTSMTNELRIRTPTAKQPAQTLSGGNQQKVVVGKWLAIDPRVLLLDEPTRGIDVGAREEIYRLMEHLASEGVAILFVSSEMEEILGISDRVLVMHEGRLSGELQREALSEETIMNLATGGTARMSA